jgi:DNA-binding response OmpR family regulator
MSGPVRGTNFRGVLDGHEFGLSGREAALLSALYEQRGQVIRYEWFSQIMGASCKGSAGKHLLRQHMLTLKQKLQRSRAPHVVTNYKKLGYALCKIAAKRSTTEREL